MEDLKVKVCSPVYHHEPSHPCMGPPLRMLSTLTASLMFRHYQQVLVLTPSKLLHTFPTPQACDRDRARIPQTQWFGGMESSSLPWSDRGGWFSWPQGSCLVPRSNEHSALPIGRPECRGEIQAARCTASNGTNENRTIATPEIIAKLESDALKQMKVVTGRQVAWMILDWFKTDIHKSTCPSFEDINGVGWPRTTSHGTTPPARLCVAHAPLQPHVRMNPVGAARASCRRLARPPSPTGSCNHGWHALLCRRTLAAAGA